MSYRLVQFVTDERDRDAQDEFSWAHIVTDDGIDGYVPQSVVRAPNGYYMCFGQRAGGWRVTEFGDGRYPDEPAVSQQRAIEVWPVDEAVSDPDLLATRTAVIEALHRQDIDPLMALMADDVYQEQRKANVRDWFTLDWTWKGEPHGTDELITALSMGGSFTTTRGRASLGHERQFCAPYVYSAFPLVEEQELLQYRFGLLIAKDVPVRLRPGVEAPIVAHASYSLVRITTSEGDRDADHKMPSQHIITYDGIDGYVPASVVREPDGSYMCFGQRAGGWRITQFGEGRFPDQP